MCEQARKKTVKFNRYNRCLAVFASGGTVKIVSVLVLGMALSACVTGVSAGEPRHEKSRDNKTTTLFRLLGKNAVYGGKF